MIYFEYLVLRLVYGKVLGSLRWFENGIGIFSFVFQEINIRLKYRFRLRSVKVGGKELSVVVGWKGRAVRGQGVWYRYILVLKIEEWDSVLFRYRDSGRIEWCLVRIGEDR